MKNPETETYPKPRLVLTGITKRYPSVVANDDISLSVRPGEIHAVLGENGAGKSTLMKIIYGITKPDAGTILWNGQYETITTPSQARRLGIGMVFQHFSLFETLTVWENIALALDERVAPAKLAAKIKEVSEKYGLANRPVSSRSQHVRWRKAACRNCALPASGAQASDHGRADLCADAASCFGVVRDTASPGIGRLQHPLHQPQARRNSRPLRQRDRAARRACQRYGDSEERNQRKSGPPDDRRRVGGVPSHPSPTEEIRLELDHLSLPTSDPFGTTLKEISLTVRSGEILGIAGVSGNGQKELMAALSGERLSPSGPMIKLLGQPVGDLNPATAPRAWPHFRSRRAPRARSGAAHEPRLQRAPHRRAKGHGVERHDLSNRHARASPRA